MADTARAEYQAKYVQRTLPFQEIMTLEEHLGWHHQACLRGLIVKWDGEGWFVILKVSINGQPMVLFTGGRHWSDAIEALMWEIRSTQPTWRPDKYAQ